MTYQEYYAEVRDTARNIVEEAQAENPEATADELSEEINDRTFETVDGHEYAIYYRHHLPILEHSDNAEAMADEHGAEALKDAIDRGGVQGLHAAMAFWAFYADVSEAVATVLEEIEAA